MRLIVVLVLSALLAFPTYLSDVSLILRKQGGPPVWEQHWWIYVAFCIAWLPIVWGIAAALPSLFGGLKATAAFTGQQAAKNSDGLVFTFGVLTSIILGPLLNFLALQIFVATFDYRDYWANSNDSYLLIFLAALFAWVPGGMLGGFIAEKARPGTGSTVASLAFFSVLLSICVAFLMA